MTPMRIPIRVHCQLPGDLAWIITERRIEGRQRLIVYLAADVLPDSPLEQHFVRQATRAWRARHHGLALLPPILIGGGWLARKLHHPRIAAAAGSTVAAAGIALAAAVTLTGPDTGNRPPTASAPRPPAAAPSPSRAAPRQPAKPAPQRPRPGRPQIPQPPADTPAAVRVGTPRLPVRVPAKVPPVRVHPPSPPVSVPSVTPPPPVKAAQCRLVEIKVGKLARVCL